VHPAVIEDYLRGATIGATRKTRATKSKAPGLSAEEKATLRLLKERTGKTL